MLPSQQGDLHNPCENIDAGQVGTRTNEIIKLAQQLAEALQQATVQHQSGTTNSGKEEGQK